MTSPLDADSITQLITQGESLTCAFARRISAAYINERRVIEMMACFANGDGGTLLIGVDRDGTVSGCHPFHGDMTHPEELAAAIFRHTSPGLPVSVAVAELDGKPVVAVTAAPQPTPIATRWGVYRTRRVNAQGTPECVGMDPAYLFTRYRDSNGMDWALVPAAGASLADIDPAATAAYRELCTDPRLRALDDEALLRALGFYNDSPEPVTLGAIALFGASFALRRHLPHHHLTLSDRRPSSPNPPAPNPPAPGAPAPGAPALSPAIPNPGALRGPGPRTVRSSAPLALMLAEMKRSEDARGTLGPAFPLVINALLHRDYFMPGPVYVALDTRPRTSASASAPTSTSTITSTSAGSDAHVGTGGGVNIVRVSSPGGAPRGVDLAAAVAGTPVYASRSLYLTTAVAHMGVTAGAGAGLSSFAGSGGGAGAGAAGAGAAGAGGAGAGGAVLSEVSFAGSHEQAVVATVTWTNASGGAGADGSGATGTAAAELTENEEKVLGVLGDAGASSSEIARDAHLSNQQAYRALRKLIDRGLARKTGETRMTRYMRS